MSRRRYNRLDETDSLYDTAEGVKPQQFEKPKSKFPVKSAAFVLSFFFGGVICLSLSFLLFFETFGKQYEDRVWPLFIVGLIMFIPGSYYSWIVVCVVFNLTDYTVDDIPIL